MFRDKIVVAAEEIMLEASGCMLWNSNQLTLSQIHVSNRAVHAMISFNQAMQPFLLLPVYNYAQPHWQPHVAN